MTASPHTVQRIALGVGLVAVVWFVISGCDILAPSFVDQLTGNAVPAGTEVSGSVLVVLNNLTPTGAILSYTYDLDVAGSSAVTTHTLTQTTSAGNYFVMSLPCPLARLAFTSLSLAGGSGTAPPVPTTQQTGSTGPTLPTADYLPPALECGSVFFVNVFGVPPNARVDVNLYK